MTMTVKFRAWDGGSLSRMYSPEEVMVGDSCIWILDEDSESNEWTVNNDLVLMQSSGMRDKNGKEIFDGDVLVSIDGMLNGVVKYNSKLGMWTNDLLLYNNFEKLWSIADSREIIGNIYENPELNRTPLYKL